MNKVLLAAAALAVCAGIVHAQTVEFRIVERKGRFVVTGPSDAQLDFAVQARVIGPPVVGIVGFGFNIHMVDEPESWGTFERGYISNPDHTASNAIAVSSSVGLGGLASQYTYLASINASFNGVINTSAGTFTNAPDQDIGLVLGQVTGQSLLSTPGIDLDANGYPDVWGGTSSPGFVSVHPLSASIAQEYFGAGATWVDVYRFRYTVTNFAARAIDVRIESATANVAAGLEWKAVQWGLGIPARAGQVLTSNARIGVGQPLAGSCCAPGGGCTIVTPAACGGLFIGSSTCVSDACSMPVNNMVGCCDPFSNTCVVIPLGTCNGVLVGESGCTACAFDPHSVLACCNAGGGCSVVATAAGCPSIIGGTETCTPLPCPLPIASGACCRTSTGICVPTLAGQCGGLYMSGQACFPSPCTAIPGTCCNLATRSCAFVPHDSCTGLNYWLALGTCGPNPCPPPLFAGACCVEGTCTLAAPALCPGTFSGAATCGVSTCQTIAACCDWTTGNCVVILSTACVGPLPVRATCTPTPCPRPPIGVQMRIVERMGRTLVTGPTTAQLDLAIQARVVSAGTPVGLASFACDLRIVGEGESGGTLARETISNPDRTYSNAFALNGTVGIGGLAAQYTALALLNSSFNGLINTSGGTFSNTPDQDIGLIVGQTSGSAFLLTPGIDNDADGNPDSWPGSGSGLAPPANTRAVLSPAAGPVYFGAAQHWIDVYHFRYTVGSFAARSLVFRLNNTQTGVFSQVAWGTSGPWAPWAASVTPSATDLVIGVIDAALGTCCDAAGNCTLVTQANCAATFTGGSSCEIGVCTTPVATGACCTVGGVCTLLQATACEGNFIGASACDPSPCPPPGLAATCCIGACCQNRACSISTESGCPTTSGYAFKGPGTTCGPDPSPFPCCRANFNQYGGVNVQDLYDFVSAWFVQDPATDFDASGMVTTVDVLEFLRVWISGC